MGTILDHTGRPYNQDRKSFFGDDGFAVPHVITFSAIMHGAWRTYWHGKYDEARKHSREDSLAMYADCNLQGMMQERKLAVASLPWYIDVPDEKNPMQKAVADHITRAIEKIPFFRKYVYTLLNALWYGRYANQNQWKYEFIEGKQTLCVKKWIPHNGDKIGHQFDGTPYLQINATQAANYPRELIGYTTEGGAFLRLEGDWRQRFQLHTHEVDDADFFEMDAADAVHGVGIRSRIYWFDWLSREWLANLTDFIERAGLGAEIWYYDGSNADSKAEVTAAAKAHTGTRTKIIAPVWNNQRTPTVERMEVPMSGADLLLRLQDRVDEIKNRYIVGQHMSSNSRASGGLGNEAAAEFQQDTKNQIKKFDAGNLEEALTGTEEEPGIVWMIQRWTFPETIPSPVNPKGFLARFRFALDSLQSTEKLNSATVLIQNGLTVKADELYACAGFTKPGDDDETVGGQMIPPGMPGQDSQAQADGDLVPEDPNGNPLVGTDESGNTAPNVVPDQHEEDSGGWEDDPDLDPDLYNDPDLFPEIAAQKKSEQYQRLGRPVHYAENTPAGPAPAPAPAPKPAAPAAPSAPAAPQPATPAKTTQLKLPKPKTTLASTGAPKQPYATTHEELATHDQGKDWEQVQTKTGGQAWRNPFIGHVAYTPRKPTVPAYQHAHSHLAKIHAPTKIEHPSEDTSKNAKENFFAHAEGDVDKHLAGLMGNPKGVRVHVSQDPYDNLQMNLSGSAPHFGDIHRRINITPKGEKVITNQLFHIKRNLRGNGLGGKVFAEQVQNAIEHGFDRIETNGARDRMYIGYKTWPLMGYDAPLNKWQKESLQRSKLPDEVKQAQTVLDLYQSPEGKKWWAKNGDSMNYTFDLTPGSRSLQVLNQRRQAKGLPEITIPQDYHEQKQKHREHSLSAITRSEKAMVERTKKHNNHLQYTLKLPQDVIDHLAEQHAENLPDRDKLHAGKALWKGYLRARDQVILSPAQAYQGFAENNDGMVDAKQLHTDAFHQYKAIEKETKPSWRDWREDEKKNAWNEAYKQAWKTQFDETKGQGGGKESPVQGLESQGDPTNPNIHAIQGGHSGQTAQQQQPGQSPTPRYTSEHHDTLITHSKNFIDSAEHLSPEQKEEYHRTWSQAVGSMTEEAAKRAAKRLKGVHYDVSWQAAAQKAYEDIIEHGKANKAPAHVMADLQKGLEEIKAGRNNNAAIYSPWTGKIYSDGLEGDLASPSDPDQHKANSLLGIKLHELGHTVAGGFLDSDPAWVNAWSREMAGQPRTEQQPGGEAKLTVYAESNPEEGFGEFFRLVHTPGINLGEVEKKFPTAARVFKDHDLWPEDGGGQPGQQEPVSPIGESPEDLTKLAGMSSHEFLQWAEQRKAASNPAKSVELLRQIDPEKFIAKSGIDRSTLDSSRGVMTAQDILRNPPADIKDAIPLGLSKDRNAGVPEIYFHMANSLGMRDWISHYDKAFAGKPLSDDPKQDTEHFMKWAEKTGKPIVMFVPSDPGAVPEGESNYTQEEVNYLKNNPNLAQRTYFVFGLYDMIHPEDAGKHIKADPQGNPRTPDDQSKFVEDVLRNSGEHQNPAMAMEKPDHPLFNDLGPKDVREEWPGVQWDARYGAVPLKEPKEFVEPMKKAINRIDVHELDSIQYYTDQSYKRFNKVLREFADNPEKMQPKDRGMLEEIHSAIEKMPVLEHPINTWRGIRLESLDQEKNFRKFIEKAMKSGQLLQMAGMQSSSLHPEIPFGFAGFTNPLIFEVKGKKGIYLDRLQGSDKQLTVNNGEFEYLMPHNTVYRILGMSKVPIHRQSQGKPVQYDVIHLEQVPDLEKKIGQQHVKDVFLKSNKAIEYQRNGDQTSMGETKKEFSIDKMTKEEWDALQKRLERSADKFIQEMDGIRAVEDPTQGQQPTKGE